MHIIYFSRRILVVLITVSLIVITGLQSAVNGAEPVSDSMNTEEKTSNITCELVKPKVTVDLKYDKYNLTYLYLFVEKKGVNIRKGPSINEPVLRTAQLYEKLNYLETVNNGEIWYHIVWAEKDQYKSGYINSNVVTKRYYQLDKMHAAIQLVDCEFTKGKITFIDNYHNSKGYPPAYKGKSVDQYGNLRSQSAPGYPDLLNMQEFIYIGDGSLVRIVSTAASYSKVVLLNDGKEYFVPNKYLKLPAPVTGINKAIGIDRHNQNEAVFEKINNDWKVISYSQATTGKTGKYHQPTPLGYYYGIEKKSLFYYYEDGTTNIQGYAPYAVRFAGSAYVHGVAVDFKYNAEGERVDPGRIEYSRTIGTIPLSHKCVRNYTSHAKFIYDWYTSGNTIVVVIE